MNLCNELISLKDSIDFLKIYDGKRSYYGGTQSWFRDNNLRKVGCSIVAAANISAYIAKNMKNKILYNYEDMSKDNFLEHMESISKFIHPDEEKGVTSISYFDNEVQAFFKHRGVIMKADMITTEDDFVNVKYFIKEALSKNKPVALLMLRNDVLKEFDWHWMTVTRIFENEHKTYIDFSTWGERRIFTLEDYYKYSSFGALSYFEDESSIY